MTKKDYELIVRALSAVRAKAGDDSVGYSDICWVLSNALQTDNPRFDRDRFISACGVPLTSGVEV